mmetsp:Transcript_5739/g.15277  ORF Transcript_5739/g.15277 Transcript_5739/m.15277 type:complete len:137 (-) Transcript_5739:78-488(-)|eukprot:CAMPEP_0171187752 /NCGR_PEP_ID=MMETSP0790-20130122/17481_1 /TAXON_ID=2925 /ORGANISM="Alexandrium catenella, Strain OF101" /LENGTH=136 /DNA_ID=CAMNT_0011652819 /DNA_START=76 /DNA_END=486 /DNA_ORIENTATION=+
MPTISELKRRRKPPPEAKWWEKPATKAGEKCTPSQTRLANVSSFTGVYRRRFEPDSRMMKSASGDICKCPAKAQRLLSGHSASDLQSLLRPGRAADFRAEIEWRMQLRPSLAPPSPLHPGAWQTAKAAAFHSVVGC